MMNVSWKLAESDFQKCKPNPEAFGGGGVMKILTVECVHCTTSSMLYSYNMGHSYDKGYTKLR